MVQAKGLRGRANTWRPYEKSQSTRMWRPVARTDFQELEEEQLEALEQHADEEPFTPPSDQLRDDQVDFIQRFLCPAGHQPSTYRAVAPFVCGGCQWAMPEGEEMLVCGECDYSRCQECLKPSLTEGQRLLELLHAGPDHQSEDPQESPSRGGRHLLSLLKGESEAEHFVHQEGAHEAPPLEDTFEGSFTEPYANHPVLPHSEVDIWLSESHHFAEGETALPESPLAVVAEGVMEPRCGHEAVGVWPDAFWHDNSTESGATDATSHFQIEGDETFEGPDGEVYEVFYPHPDRDHLGERQTSAETSLADVMAFMRRASHEQYPARAKFFQLAQEAAAVALGPHFERLALVGSTALRIETPDSDVDAVAFTRAAIVDGKEVEPPAPAQALRRIAQIMQTRDPSLRVQLVDCARVPVLTVLSADGHLALDLTVDQPLGEWHVMWFQKLLKLGGGCTGPLAFLPPPSGEANEEECLESAVLRCVKWWLRCRRIPTSKDGGYPTVVWTLMLLHVLRCSVFLNDSWGAGPGPAGSRVILGAIAAFFDRFSEVGLSGTFVFTGGLHAEFRSAPHPHLLSVLDPTTTSEDGTEAGIHPLELAPPLSAATQLLHAYELRRAQRLSAAALGPKADEFQGGQGAGCALRELFRKLAEEQHILPSVSPSAPLPVLILSGGWLLLGLLQKVRPKPGWNAPFLHRRDGQSVFAVELCDVDAVTGDVVSCGPLLHWFHPVEFVCAISLYRRESSDGYPESLYLDEDDLERWNEMLAILLHANSQAPPVGRQRVRNRRTRARY